MNFLSFSLNQSTALSSRAVHSRQMYSDSSVVGKASTIGIEISPTPSNFHRESKKCKFGVVFNITRESLTWAVLEENIGETKS